MPPGSGAAADEAQRVRSGGRFRARAAAELRERVPYGSSIAPATFSAELEGRPFAGFTPAPAASETLAIPLAPGRNVLVLSVEGTLADGRRATDRDRLTFVVR